MSRSDSATWCSLWPSNLNKLFELDATKVWVCLHLGWRMWSCWDLEVYTRFELLGIHTRGRTSQTSVNQRFHTPWADGCVKNISIRMCWFVMKSEYHFAINSWLEPWILLFVCPLVLIVAQSANNLFQSDSNARNDDGMESCHVGLYPWCTGTVVGELRRCMALPRDTGSCMVLFHFVRGLRKMKQTTIQKATYRI